MLHEQSPFYDHLANMALAEVEKIVMAPGLEARMRCVSLWVKGKKDMKRRVKWRTIPTFVERKANFVRDQRRALRQKARKLKDAERYLRRMIPEMKQHAEEMEKTGDFIENQ